MHEFLIVQNYTIGALALHAFTKEYFSRTNEKKGVSIPLMMPVLPLVFNEKSCKYLLEVKKVTLSRFLTTLSDYRDIPVGLQKRMVEMSTQTLKSLNIALSLNLLSYQKETSELLPVKFVRLPNLEYKLNQDVIHASKVLGAWFSGYSVEEICSSLNIYF